MKWFGVFREPHRSEKICRMNLTFLTESKMNNLLYWEILRDKVDKSCDQLFRDLKEKLSVQEYDDLFNIDKWHAY